MSEPSEPTAKVLFRVPNENGGADVETLWAYDLGSDKYKIDNMPYYAYGVSCDDVVLAPYDEDEQFPTFQKVVSKSGNRTIRIIFEVPMESGNESGDLVARLVHLGCAFEGANKKYIVITIPPKVDLNLIADQLNKAEVSWEYADPTLEELFPGEST
jgi:hypothetical protein